MWLVTQHGFYNIIQYPDDKEANLLTIKARRREDLEALREEDATLGEVEESTEADYRFRLKGDKSVICDLVAAMVDRIDYPKTKDALRRADPERMPLYTTVWSILLGLQKGEWADFPSLRDLKG